MNYRSSAYLHLCFIQSAAGEGVIYWQYNSTQPAVRNNLSLEITNMILFLEKI